MNRPTRWQLLMALIPALIASGILIATLNIKKK